MTPSSTTQESGSLPCVSHIKKLEELMDYVEWSHDIQVTLINGGRWKYVCPHPTFHMTDPEFLPCYDPMLDEHLRLLPTSLPPEPTATDASEPEGVQTCSAKAAAASAAAVLEARHREWVRGDNTACHVILSTVAHHIKTSLPPVITSKGITHTHDYWKLIKDDYDTVTFDDTADLEARLSLLKMTDSPLRFISEIRRIQSILLERGSGVPEVSLINHLICGLPDERRWKDWRRIEMATWKLRCNITFNEVARSVITQATSFNIGHTEVDCHKKKWDEDNKQGEWDTSKGEGTKTKEKAQVMTDTLNTQTVKDLVLLINEDFFDYVGRSKSVQPASTSPFHEMSAPTLSRTSFNLGGEFSSIILVQNATIFNSRCTSHIFRDQDVFNTYDAKQATDIATTNCGVLTTLAKGKVAILLRFCGQMRWVVLRDCLHAPDAAMNLLSQGRLDHDGFFITTGDNKVLLFCRMAGSDLHEIWTEAPRIGFLYFPEIKFAPISSNSLITSDLVQLSVIDSFNDISDAAAYLHVPLTAELWHARFGHTGKDYTLVMLSGRYTTGIQSTTKTMTSHCESCIIGKHPCKPYPYPGNCADNPLDLIHIDICGPFPVATPDKFNYFIVYLDDNTNHDHVDLLRKKSETLHFWITLRNRWERLTGHKVDGICTDGALEFLSRPFQADLAAHGIRQDMSCPYAHQQNGKAERLTP